MKKKQWWEFSEKQMKEVKEAIISIWGSFHSIAFKPNRYGVGIDVFHQACWDIVRDEVDSLCKKLDQIDPKNKISEDYLYDGVVDKSFFCGFAFGYIVGQTFDLNDPDVLNGVKVLKTELEARQAFPSISWLPRERGART